MKEKNLNPFLLKHGVIKISSLKAISTNLLYTKKTDKLIGMNNTYNRNKETWEKREINGKTFFSLYIRIYEVINVVLINTIWNNLFV